MSNFTIHNGENAENSMVFFSEYQKDRLIGLHIYIDDEDYPDRNAEDEFSFSYEDSVLLRNFLSGVIDIHEKNIRSKE